MTRLTFGVGIFAFMSTLFLPSPAVLGQKLHQANNALPKAITKWSADIEKLEALDAQEKDIRGGILFCGSSSIRLWKSIQQDMDPWKPLQRGYGGAKLTDLNHYAGRLIGPHLGKDNPRRCRAVVVFVANDIAGKKGEVDPKPQEVIDRFAKLRQYIRSQDQNVPFFWIEVTPTEKRWHVWPQIEAVTRGIKKQILDDPNSFLISTAGAYLGSDGKPRADLFVNDRLHLNQVGYQLWANLIKASLHRELGAASVPETESLMLPKK